MTVVCLWLLTTFLSGYGLLTLSSGNLLRRLLLLRGARWTATTLALTLLALASR